MLCSVCTIISKPHKAEQLCLDLSKKLRKVFLTLTLFYLLLWVNHRVEMGRLLKKETIFCERKNNNFELRRVLKSQKD